MDGTEDIWRRDRELVEIVDLAMAESARRGGDWVKCRPGCTPCCKGPFEITERDAMRLRDGFQTLAASDPERAGRVWERADAYMKDALPLLRDGTELPESWDGVPCPVLDPESGLCELYESRPLICRTFGAATKRGNAVSACEICYEGVSDAEIAAVAVELSFDEEDAAPSLPFLALAFVKT